MLRSRLSILRCMQFNKNHGSMFWCRISTSTYLRIFSLAIFPCQRRAICLNNSRRKKNWKTLLVSVAPPTQVRKQAEILSLIISHVFPLLLYSANLRWETPELLLSRKQHNFSSISLSYIKVIILFFPDLSNICNSTLNSIVSCRFLERSVKSISKTYLSCY